MISVAVVDDHPIVTSGLRASLDGQPDLEVVWAANDVASARAALGGASPPVDVVLVDVRLPDGSGLDLLPGARGGSGPAFLVISTFDRPLYAATAFRRGASGFLLKIAPTAEIGDAIRRVAAGGLAFEARHLESVREGTSLTPRELEVVRLVAASLSNDEIAAQLGISPKTVEAYLREIFRRHSFQSRTELAVWAVHEGWLDAP
jgi:DNA-binding NarL/FixJ family response regulator